jgi:hypothetical protein
VATLEERAKRAGFLRVNEKMGQSRQFRAARAHCGITARQRGRPDRQGREWVWRLAPQPAAAELVEGV